MTLTRDSVDCDNNFDWATTWLLPLMDKIVDYINALEAAQNQATDAVSSEVGVARSGFATLLAKIQDMDGVSADLLAMVQGIAAGIDPVVYDPTATYEKNARVVYDGGLYICIAADPVIGIAPPADGVWKNMLGWEKCPTPTLAGPLAADEGTPQRISLGTSYDANALYWPTVSGGTLSKLMQFSDDGNQYAGEWGWEWTLPTLSVDVPHQIIVYATKDGYARSNDFIWSVTVRDVPVEEATVSWPDTAENYIEGTVAGGIITAPARTVGCDSATQLLAVSPEILIVNGKLVLLDGSTESVLKLAVLVAAGDVIITDKGECVVASVESTSQLGSTILPQMTANTQDGFTVSASSEHSAPFLAHNATLQDLTLAYASYNPGLPVSWNALAPAPRSLAKIVLTAGSSNNYRTLMPKDFTLQGRLSGGAWETLLTETGIIYSADGESKTFDLIVGEYDEWQLVVTAVGDAGNQCIIGYIGLIEGVMSYSASLAQPLPGVPTKAFKKGVVQLKVAAGATGQAFTESDFTLNPTDYTYVIDGDDLKITGAEIDLDDNPDIKRIALAVSGPDGMKFNRALAYIKRVS